MATEIYQLSLQKSIDIIFKNNINYTDSFSDVELSLHSYNKSLLGILYY